MTDSTAERAIKANILLAIGSRQDARLFNNPVGMAWTGEPTQRDGAVILRNARPVRYGLAPGSSDLIGWTSVLITPEMVGQRLPVFTAIECKTATGRLAREQLQFINVVCGFGGIAGVARSPEDAAALIAAGPSFRKP